MTFGGFLPTRQVNEGTESGWFGGGKLEELSGPNTHAYIGFDGINHHLPGHTKTMLGNPSWHDMVQPQYLPVSIKAGGGPLWAEP